MDNKEFCWCCRTMVPKTYQKGWCWDCVQSDLRKLRPLIEVRNYTKLRSVQPVERKNNE